jgi:carbon-monoxide dehydrogenase medium subunit
VIPAPFDYAVAHSVEQAIEMLSGDGDAKLLAGGHSLVPAMRLRFARPELLVDLGRLTELRGVRDAGDHLAIGAMTRHADLVRDRLVAQHCGVLAQAAALVGDRQVRHRGTLGGAVAHADPNGDLGTVLLALDADFIVRGPEGERTVAAGDFFQSWYQTALGEHDVLTEIRVAKGATGTYLKHSRRSHDWATVGVAAIRLGGTARVALTSMAPTPLRARGAEDALAAGAGAATAAARAAEGTSPVSDAIAGADYRAHLACVLTRRALEQLSPP